MVAISRSLSEGSFLNLFTPTFLSTCQRRHLALNDFHLDRARPGPRVLISEQRHRSDGARPMAVLACLLKDGRNILVERDRGLGGQRDRTTAEEDCDETGLDHRYLPKPGASTDSNILLRNSFQWNQSAPWVYCTIHAPLFAVRSLPDREDRHCRWDCIKHGGDHATGSGMARCFRKSGCHSRNRL